MLRRDFPLVCQWAVRCHEGTPSPQGESGWLEEDQVPETISPILRWVF